MVNTTMSVLAIEIYFSKSTDNLRQRKMAALEMQSKASNRILIKLTLKGIASVSI